MAKIAFFCIPAHGHTNPTLAVVRALTAQGHVVRYYSYAPFREKIEAVGAEFVDCGIVSADHAPTPEAAAKVGSALGVSIRLLVDTTLALDTFVCESLRLWRPDCVVADSMAVWGRLAARKLNLPFVSSTTTFAFNRYSAKGMEQEKGQLWSLLRALPGIRRDVRRLRKSGYPIKSWLELIANDNETDTIVYTSREFQPCAETFSDRFAFVGPSIRQSGSRMPASDRPLVYISMGTVVNRMPDFYRNCVAAFTDSPYEVLLSVGADSDIDALGVLPDHITAEPFVDQIAVLKRAEVFLTHCGMNSVSEALYHGVPLVLFPQTAEQHRVASRTAELGAGILLPDTRPETIRAMVDRVLADRGYADRAAEIAAGFRAAGGAPAAAEFILKKCKKQERIG
ncbi:MAG: glucosyltransferase [Butyricicoccus sp.]|nr:glucosyltransferase [Butyricicoccus sp.]